MRCNDSSQPKLVETLKDIAAQTAGVLPIDLTAIVADAAASAATRHVGLEGVCKDSPQGMELARRSRDAALHINADDFDRALGNMRQRTAISIGAPQVCVPVMAAMYTSVCINLCLHTLNLSLEIHVPRAAGAKCAVGRCWRAGGCQGGNPGDRRPALAPPPALHAGPAAPLGCTPLWAARCRSNHCH